MFCFHFIPGSKKSKKRKNIRRGIEEGSSGKKLRIKDLGSIPPQGFLKLSSFIANNQSSQKDRLHTSQNSKSTNSAGTPGHTSKPCVALNSLPPSSVNPSKSTVCADDDDDIQILPQPKSFFGAESTSLVLVWYRKLKLYQPSERRIKLQFSGHKAKMSLKALISAWFSAKKTCPRLCT